MTDRSHIDRKVRGREFEEDVPWARLFDLDDT
jgi:hypothetical protein